MRRSEIQEMIRVDQKRRFVRAMSRAIEGQPITQNERHLLDAIFVGLLRGDDVADLTGIKPAHNRRSDDRIHVALHYLCLTQLMEQKAEAAWQTVGDAWGLRKQDVQKIVATNWAAISMLQKFAGAPEKLLELCEQRAWTSRPGRRRPVIVTPAAGLAGH
jgi:hypothetical protein